METKKKFEKNIFTEVIKDKSIKNTTSDSQKINKQIDNNKDNIAQAQKENINNKISSKNLKIIKKIYQICSQDFILIEN